MKAISTLELYKMLLGFTPVVLGLSAVRIYPDWFVNLIIFMTSLCTVIFGVNSKNFVDQDICKFTFVTLIFSILSRFHYRINCDLGGCLDDFQRSRADFPQKLICLERSQHREKPYFGARRAT